MHKFVSIITILLLGTLIYSNSLNGEMVFDDYYYITSNPTIKDITNLKAIWNAYSEHTRFIGLLSFALNYHIAKLDVFGYHLFNLIIHLLGAISVRWFIVLLFQTPTLKQNALHKHKETIALLTALLFLVHPIQTQAVAYISQRLACLATLFYVLTLCLYIKGRLTGKVFLLCGAFISALLGMFTKEIVFTLPFTILLLEWGVLKPNDYRFKLTQIPKGGLAALILFVILIPALYSFRVKLVLFDPRISGSHLGDVFSSGTYFLTQLKVILVYIRLLLFPIGQNLDYDFPMSKGLFEASTFMSFMALCGLLFIAVKLWKNHRLASVGLWWFFITLSVESSIIPIQHAIFEHRVYLPSIGFFLTCIVLLFEWNVHPKRNVAIVSCIILLFSIMTFQRNKVWQSKINLWTDVTHKSPQKARGYYNLANAYFDAGDYNQALTNYNQAITLNPKHFKAVNSRGVLYKEMGRLDLAMNDYNRAVELKPRFGKAFSNRAIIHFEHGNFNEALADTSRAIEINPYLEESYSNRGVIYQNLGQPNLAIQDYTIALKLNPNLYQAYNNRAKLYWQINKLELALNDFNQSITLNPKDSMTFYNRSIVYQSLNKPKMALEDAKKAQGLGYVGIEPRIAELEALLR